VTEQTVTKETKAGVVVIGRNEGERLKRCLASVLAQHRGPIVYVDSGSTDGSVEHAKSVNVEVVALDMTRPFTMARGRNAGLDYLLEHYPDCEFVQFVDGDCEVAAEWIERGLQFLEQHPDYAGVCGNRSERYPQATIYNRLIAMEWQGCEGEVDACGGDAIYRVASFSQTDQLSGASCQPFNEAMIAGEEADLCLRLRHEGWYLMRLDAPMTVHDANIQRFVQWWCRSVRCGHAYAQGYHLHRRDDGHSHYKRKALLSSLFYGIALPALLVLLLVMQMMLSLSAVGQLFLLMAELLVISFYLRIAQRAMSSKSDASNSPRQRALYALFITLGKLPEAQGALRYWLNCLRGKNSDIIEYRQV